jgi:hypothetical protein
MFGAAHAGEEREKRNRKETRYPGGGGDHDDCV